MAVSKAPIPSKRSGLAYGRPSRKDIGEVVGRKVEAVLRSLQIVKMIFKTL